MTAVQIDRLLNCSYITARGFSVKSDTLIVIKEKKQINSILLLSRINHTRISGLIAADENQRDDEPFHLQTKQETPHQRSSSIPTCSDHVKPCKTFPNDHQQLKPYIFRNVVCKQITLSKYALKYYSTEGGE